MAAGIANSPSLQSWLQLWGLPGKLEMLPFGEKMCRENRCEKRIPHTASQSELANLPYLSAVPWQGLCWSVCTSQFHQQLCSKSYCNSSHKDDITKNGPPSKSTKIFCKHSIRRWKKKPKLSVAHYDSVKLKKSWAIHPYFRPDWRLSSRNRLDRWLSSQANLLDSATHLISIVEQ